MSFWIEPSVSYKTSGLSSQYNVLSSFVAAIILKFRQITWSAVYDFAVLPIKGRVHGWAR